jgi:thiamine biosynthesis lipoprotein ApbE
MNDRLASVTFPALGTTATLVVTSPGDLTGARDRLNDALADIDRAASRFRDDSELSEVNRAEGQPVAVGPVFLDALDTAIRAARLTDGAVDPTIGAAMRLLGYDRDFAAVARTGEPLTCVVTRVPGWRTVEIDRLAGTVRVPEGVELDLGATAKAFAADRAAASIADTIEGGVLVSLGGDVAVGGITPEDGWPVRVTDDHASGPDTPGQTIAMFTGGLATSSTTVRHWRRGDDTLHHIVDPRTGRPAPSPWRTVSVAASTCVDANISSTAAVVRGEDAPGWLSERGLAARLVGIDGHVIHLGGWPADEEAS